MATKKTQQLAPIYTIEGCQFIAEAGKVSPEAAKAIEALARASERHAEALLAIAKAMQTTPGNLQTGVHIGPKS